MSSSTAASEWGCKGTDSVPTSVGDNWGHYSPSQSYKTCTYIVTTQGGVTSSHCLCILNNGSACSSALCCSGLITSKTMTAGFLFFGGVRLLGLLNCLWSGRRLWNRFMQNTYLHKSFSKALYLLKLWCCLNVSYQWCQGLLWVFLAIGLLLWMYMLPLMHSCCL